MRLCAVSAMIAFVFIFAELPATNSASQRRSIRGGSKRKATASPTAPARASAAKKAPSSRAVAPTASSRAKSRRSGSTSSSLSPSLPGTPTQKSQPAPKPTKSATNPTSKNVVLAKILALIRILKYEENLGRIVRNGKMEDQLWLKIYNPAGNGDKQLGRASPGTDQYYVDQCLVEIRRAQKRLRDEQLPPSMLAVLNAAGAPAPNTAASRQLANRMINHHLVSQLLAHAEKGARLATAIKRGTEKDRDNVGKARVRQLCEDVLDEYESLERDYAQPIAMISARDIPGVLADEGGEEWVALSDVDFDYIYRPELPYFKPPLPGQLVKAKSAIQRKSNAIDAVAAPETIKENVEAPVTPRRRLSETPSSDEINVSPANSALFSRGGSVATPITDPDLREAIDEAKGLGSGGPADEALPLNIRLANVLLDRVLTIAVRDNARVMDVFMDECKRLGRCRKRLVDLFGEDDVSRLVGFDRDMKADTRNVQEMRIRITARVRERSARNQRRRGTLVHRHERQTAKLAKEEQKRREEEEREQRRQELAKKLQESEKKNNQLEAEVAHLREVIRIGVEHIREKERKEMQTRAEYNHEMEKALEVVDMLATEIGELNQAVVRLTDRMAEKAAQEQAELEAIEEQHALVVANAYPKRSLLAKMRGMVFNVFFTIWSRVWTMPRNIVPAVTAAATSLMPAKRQSTRQRIANDKT